MILFRNITRVIQYEKEKNQFRYQEMLAGTISHEMKTPLNAILNMSSLIENKIQKKKN